MKQETKELSTFQAPKLAVWIFNLMFSKRTWKFISLGVVIGSLWYSIHTFVNTYNIVWSNGIYGVVSETRWDEIVKAQEDISMVASQLNEANYDLELNKKVRDAINADLLN